MNPTATIPAPAVQPAGPCDIPSAWTAQVLREDRRWIFTLGTDDVAELEVALAHAKARGAAVPGLAKEDFPLPRLAAKLEAVRRELETGLGVALVRGLPVERYSKSDAGMIFWGMGTHFGRSVAQNASGDVLGHVFDLGRDPRKDMGSRGYQSNLKLSFHTDSCDVVGLLCLRTSLSGGASSIASSVGIHNEMLRTRPDLLAELYGPFYSDLRNEQGPGERPYYTMPVYMAKGGRVYARYVRRFIESGQRFPEVPRFTAAQVEALDLLDSLAASDRFRYDMQFQPGDMQFLCNYSVLHSRTGFVDHPEIDRKRHLLRLWLFTPGFPDVPEEFQARYRHSESWQKNPRPPVYDLAELMGPTAH